jgi:hypothetical protein
MLLNLKKEVPFWEKQILNKSFWHRAVKTHGVNADNAVSVSAQMRAIPISKCIK